MLTMKWQKKFAVNKQKSVFCHPKRPKLYRIVEPQRLEISFGHDDVLCRVLGGAFCFHLTSAQYFVEEIYILVANVAAQ